MVENYIGYIPVSMCVQGRIHNADSLFVVVSSNNNFMSPKTKQNKIDSNWSQYEVKLNAPTHTALS